MSNSKPNQAGIAVVPKAILSGSDLSPEQLGILGKAWRIVQDSADNDLAERDQELDNGIENAQLFGKLVTMLDSGDLNMIQNRLALSGCAMLLARQTAKMIAANTSAVGTLFKNLQRTAPCGLMASCLILSSMGRFARAKESSYILDHERTSKLYKSGCLAVIDAIASSDSKWVPQAESCLRLLEADFQGKPPRSTLHKAGAMIVVILLATLGIWVAGLVLGSPVEGIHASELMIKFSSPLLLLLYLVYKKKSMKLGDSVRYAQIQAALLDYTQRELLQEK